MTENTSEEIPEGFTKIVFRFYSEVLDREMVETLWAEIISEESGRYRIDSIPFYIPFIATDDIVGAEYDSDANALVFVEKIKSSGNSIVWVAIMSNVIKMEMIQDIMHEMDCESEAFNDRFLSMEVKTGTNFLKVRNKLLELKEEGLIDFQEAFISEEHLF
ncbi:MAG TPA: DUF4265 domain-containing protein [Flavitalea sp.]|nr:DUF4265 domain-containing protein [Flavitalea sp.]